MTVIAVLLSIALACFAAMTTISATYTGRMDEQMLLDNDGRLGIIDKPIPVARWLRLLIAQHKLERESEHRHKVAALSKRNNGMWVWMPSQGYVSVANQLNDDSSENKLTNKQGKILRYGK